MDPKITPCQIQFPFPYNLTRQLKAKSGQNLLTHSVLTLTDSDISQAKLESANTFNMKLVVVYFFIRALRSAVLADRRQSGFRWQISLFRSRVFTLR